MPQQNWTPPTWCRLIFQGDFTLDTDLRYRIRVARSLAHVCVTRLADRRLWRTERVLIQDVPPPANAGAGFTTASPTHGCSEVTETLLSTPELTDQVNLQVW